MNLNLKTNLNNTMSTLPISLLIEWQRVKRYMLRVLYTVKGNLVRHVKNERGIGTLELIFITVIVLGMAVLFRNQITDIFKKIYEALQKLNQNLNTDPLSQQNT